MTDEKSKTTAVVVDAPFTQEPQRVEDHGQQLLEKEAQIVALKEQVRRLEEKVTEKSHGPSRIESSEDDKWLLALLLLELPTKVQQMRLELEANPTALLRTFDYWCDSIWWRHEIIQQLSRVEKNHFMSTSSMMDVIAQQFECVDSLGSRICDQLWYNMRNAIELVQLSPHLIRDCIAIVSRTDEPAESEKAQVLKSTLLQMNCSGADGLLQFESMKKKLVHEITLAIELKSEAIMTMNGKRGSIHDDEEVVPCLIEGLHVVKKDLAPLFPIEYNILKIYQSLVVRETAKQLENIIAIQTPSDMQTTFRNLAWLDTLKKQVNVSSGMNDLVNLIEKAEGTLSSFHINLVEKYAREAEERIVRRAYPVQVAKERYLFSDSVEILLAFVAEKIAFLKTHLQGKRLRESVHLCVAVIQARQEYQQDELLAINRSNLESIPDGYLEDVCCIINDCERIRRLLPDIVNLCGEQLLNQEEKEMLRNHLVKVATGFGDVVKEAVEASTRMVFQDLSAQLAGLFSPRWLNVTSAPILTCLATFDDYFTDIDQWIKEEEDLGAIKSACIGRLVKQYVEKLLEGPLYFQPSDMNQVSIVLAKDFSCLEDYCRSKIAHLFPLHDVKRKNLEKSLVILHQLSRFFESADPALLFAELAHELGKSAGSGLERLVRLRTDLSKKSVQQTAVDVAEWNLWASTAAETSHRFRIAAYAEDHSLKTSSKSTAQRAQEMLGKGIRKVQRSSLTKHVSSAIPMKFKGKGKGVEDQSKGRNK